MDRYSYQLYEMLHLAFAPARALSEATTQYFKSGPFGDNPVARNILASAELFERMTRRYGKPTFGLASTVVEGEETPIAMDVVWSRPFCQLLRFRREFAGVEPRQSKLLIIAPMSGHYATLLRGTVEALLPYHDVYITDWSDARAVPHSDGRFDLDDYIDYLVAIMTQLAQDGGPVHTLGVCQASVPLICAVAAMEARNDPAIPESMVLMGGPIDPRVNPTAVNKLAVKRGIGWFKHHCIHAVPFPNPGMGRRVYPGFLQLSGFMAMNIERHV
ncbi:MAG TPA: polyhydroxyalkanoate depolymerase, partial [Methylocystis sp.]|nr:polyhydroxyalkanoate depolymerase [Methylocystis sp.]